MAGKQMHHCGFWAWLAAPLLLPGWLVPAVHGGEPVLPLAGVTFYASFDQSLVPDRAAGAPAVAGQYAATPGRLGNGILDQSALRYLCAGNLNRQLGSVSFWIKPAAALASAPHDFRLFTTDNHDSINFAYDRRHNVLYFMTAWTPPGRDWVWDYALHVRPEAMPPGAWTHVVLTWNVDLTQSAGPASGVNLPGGDTRQGQKKLYLNGALAGSATIGGIDDRDEGGFALARSDGAPYAADELTVWDRALTAAEVKALYEHPDTFARAVKALPPAAKRRNWIVYPDLVYRNYNDSLVAPGDTYRISVPLKNLTDRPVTGTLRLRLLDLWEQPCGAVQARPFSCQPRQSLAVPAEFVAPKLGIFKVEATVEVGGASESRDITSFACIPPGCPPKHPFFGGHINFSPGMPEMARRLGYSAHRCHDMTRYTWWNVMEPERGKMAMLHEYLYQAAAVNGFDQMGEWFATPYWAVTYADGTHPAKPGDPMDYPAGWVPTDEAAYTRYVREAVVRHPLIKEWCIWNEPWSTFFFNGSAKDYLRLSEVTYQTAKAADPSLTIYAFMDMGIWGRAVLQGGLLNYCDGLTYHMYCGPGRWDAARQQIRTIRTFLKKYTDKEVPLSNSEGGITASTFLRGLDFPELPPEGRRPPLDFRLGAERLLQYYVTTMAEGVRSYYYYFHQPVDPASSYAGWSSVEVTRTPRPFIVALCMLTWQLDGGRYLGELELPGALHLYVFSRRDGTSMAVAWSVDGGVVDLTTDARAVDLMGNDLAPAAVGAVRITDAPMYLRSKLDAAAFRDRLATARVMVVTPPRTTEEAANPGVYVPQRMEPYSIASELGAARMLPVDLRPYANRGLADERAGDGLGGWTDEGEFNDLRSLQPGTHTWLGVPMTIIDPAANHGNSVVALRGRTLPKAPAASPAIPIGRKARGFFFLHAANYAQVSQARAGTYQVRYADGQMVEIPVIIGLNIYDWWMDRQDNEDSRTVPVLVENAAEDSQPYRFLRLWYWENTRQDVPVTSITLTTQPGSPASLLLLGLDIAVW